MDNDGESSGGDSGIVEDFLPDKMGPNSRYRMKLTSQEHEQALEIKQAIEATPELDNLSDFMYAQLAIVSENVNDAMRRTSGLQCFREKHRILQTYEFGCRALQRHVESCPLAFLSSGFNPDEGTYMLVQDAAKFDTSAITTDELRREFFAGQYYLVR